MTHTPRLSRPLLVVLLAALAAVLLAPATPAHASAPGLQPGDEEQFLRLLNEERAKAGRAPVRMSVDARLVARDWTLTMQAERRLYHRPNMTEPFIGNWRGMAENVALGNTVESIHNNLMSSSGHRANALGNYDWVGIGVAGGGNYSRFVTFNFVKGDPTVHQRFHADSRLHPNARFLDVRVDHRFAGDIAWLTDRQVTSGCRSGSIFCPGGAVTRGQMAAFLTRALDLKPGNARFADVPTSHPFAAEISALASAGITTGCRGGSHFCPDDPVTRGQMAAFLTKALNLKAGSARFADVPSSHTFADAISSLASAGVTTGCGSNRFCPGGTVSRGQMAAFLTRALR